MTFIHYPATRGRIKWLKNNINELEKFLTLDDVTQTFIDYLNDIYECIKSGVDITKEINKLELYNANLQYCYNQL